MVKTEEMLNNLEELINTPSVVGFYPEIHKKLAEMVGKFGYELEFDNKRTAMFVCQVKILVRLYV